MSPAAHFIPQKVTGYGLLDDGYTSVSGNAFKLSPHSSGNEYTRFPHVKVLYSGHAYQGVISSIRIASSTGQRKPPDFSRKTSHGFSKNKNMLNQDSDTIQPIGNPKDAEPFFSKTAMPLLSGTASLDIQDTATTGPNEREIVQLFRKVQVQLRERTKVENLQKTHNQKKTGDALTGLVEFPDQEHEGQRREVRSPSRPVSNFHRRSPIPQLKYDLILSGKDTVSSGPYMKSVSMLESKVESESRPEVKRNFTGVEDSGEVKAVEPSDLSKMKLAELRAVAKSRGLKGFSKLKKQELFKLLASIDRT